MRFGNDGFPIYLNKGDSIYFEAATANTKATQRLMNGMIYPMF